MTIVATGPDGERLEFPDGTDRAVMQKAIKSYVDRKSQDDLTRTETDIAKSLGRGVVHGAEGVIGLPGTVGRAQAGAIDWAADELGLDQDSMIRSGLKTAGEALNPLARRYLPSGEDVQNFQEGVTGDLGHAETVPGDIAEKVGEQLPTSVVGPGGAALKLGGAVASGLGSYVGEQLGGRTGEVVGGTLGGLAAGKINVAKTERDALGRLAKKDTIKAASKAGYQMLDRAPYPVVTRSPSGVATITPSRTIPVRDQFSLAGDIRREVYTNQHIDSLSAPQTYGIVRNALGSGRPIRMSEIMGLHERLGNVGYVPGHGADFVASLAARQQIRNWIQGLGYGGQMRDALGNWAMQAKIGEIEKAEQVAEHRAAVSGTGSNVQNTMRQEIRKILDSDEKIRRFPPQVREQMERIVRGTLLANAARWAGRFAPTGLHSSAFVLILSQLMKAPIATGVAVTGFAFKKLADYLTYRDIQHLTTVLMENAPINRGAAQFNNIMRQIAQEGASAATARGGIGAYFGGSAGDVNDTLDNPSGIPLQ